MSDSVKVVVTAAPNPADPAAMKQYIQGVLPLFGKVGATIVARSMIKQVVAGDPDYKMVLILAFESADVAEGMFESAAYKELIPLRDRGFAHMNISIAQDM